MFMEAIKKSIRRAGRPFGVSILKYPSSPFRPLPLFDLCVQFLMAARGPNLEFIQVGANDGSFGDPLRKYVLKFPWHGVLVEPQPDVFVRLCANYAEVGDRLIFENAAIASGVSEIAMYRVGAAGSAAAYSESVSSMDPKVAARQLKVRKSQLERILVPCTTLDRLVEKHGIKKIDILQIDAEGQDCKVLTTLDLSRHTPLIVQFEHGHLPFREVDAAVQYLARHGYRVLYGGHQIDTVALHASFPLQAE